MREKRVPVGIYEIILIILAMFAVYTTIQTLLISKRTASSFIKAVTKSVDSENIK